MKYLLSILCLFVLSCDSGSDDAEVEGCTDETACNYDEIATIDNGSCLELDCNNQCGGSFEESINNCEICAPPDYYEGYYCTDVYVLQDIIDENQSLSFETPITITAITDWENGRLISLDLNNHSLTSIPETIGALSKLEFLFLYSNELTNIPESIKNLTSLKELMLGFNNLTDFPSSIYEITSLIGLWIENNAIDASITSEIGALINLSHLNLQNNLFTSIIPDEICNLDLNYDNLGETYVWDEDVYYGGDNNTWHYFNIENNKFCTEPYPECIKDYIGTQVCP